MSCIIWFKYGNTQATDLMFQGTSVNKLKKDIKKELGLSASPNRILLKKYNTEVILEPNVIIDDSFGRTAKTPLLVSVQSVQSGK